MVNSQFLARINMVNNQILPSQVTDSRLKEAMLKLPRELFVPVEFSSIAYADTSIKVGTERALMDPTTFARLAQLTQAKDSDMVLDIGCGTGYSTGVFATLAKKVISIEPEEKLASDANYTLNQLGIRNAIIISETLLDGHPEGGPYDVIFLNGSVKAIPNQLIDQLAEGGRLVGVIRNKGKLGEAVVLERHGDKISKHIMFGANIPPLLQEEADNDESFIF